ncbi:MAG: phosphotransferase [Coxiellaceae bacterium]|nr:phosphotransferase [Coxiellaceae bacterium]
MTELNRNNPALLSPSELICRIIWLQQERQLPSQFSSPIAQVEELSEGNINQVFRVVFENTHSLIAKFAPPFAYRYQSIKVANQRNAFEASVFKQFSQHHHQTYPEIYYVNSHEHILLMEDLQNCVVMRDALMQGQRFSHFAEQIVMAICAYPGNKPVEKTPPGVSFAYCDGIPDLQDITRDFVFQHPFGLDYPNGSVCLEGNLAWVQQNIFDNTPLQAARARLEQTYYQKTDVLIHGDLHTGSIMLNDNNTYFIDAEFARVGPISFDIGMLIANLIMSALVANYHLGKTTDEKAQFQFWLIQVIQDIFDGCCIGLSKKGFDQATIQSEIVGYCAIEIIRRTIGAAQIQDFLSIKDETIRTVIERQALNIAVQQLTKMHESAAWDMTIALLKHSIEEADEASILH